MWYQLLLARLGQQFEEVSLGCNCQLYSGTQSAKAGDCRPACLLSGKAIARSGRLLCQYLTDCLHCIVSMRDDDNISDDDVYTPVHKIKYTECRVCGVCAA